MSNVEDKIKDVGGDLVSGSLAADKPFDLRTTPIPTPTNATAPTSATTQIAPNLTQQVAKPVVKPTIEPAALGGVNTLGKTYSHQEVLDMAKMAEEIARKAIREERFDPSKDAQVMLKSKAPITDFSKMTQDDIFDLEIPITAKPFMDADILKVVLKDSNYEARWVNKNPQNMGNYISKGFRYVGQEDLLESAALEVAKDAEDHYTYGDVVCMMIDKATYYMALRHAHERAVNTTKQTNAVDNGASQAAQSFRDAGMGNEFEAARRAGHMKFYKPGIEV